MNNDANQTNACETLAREMRKPTILLDGQQALLSHGSSMQLAAIPKDYELKQLDFEHLSPHPRHAKGAAQLSDTQSFTEFVARHASPESTVVWCESDPVNNVLRFVAVFDDHAKGTPGWRHLTATFTPEKSVEFTRWTQQANKDMTQTALAEHIERNQDDIASPPDVAPPLPTSLDMLKMATEFEANADRRFKSHVRLQSGGANLTYVDEDNAETQARMSMFDRFGLGLPVFRGEPAYLVLARLRYRVRDAKLTFNYELLRVDRTVEKASTELIEKVRAGLNGIPLLMGSFTSARN